MTNRNRCHFGLCFLIKDDNREEAWKKEIDNLDKESTQLPKFLADIRDAKTKPKINIVLMEGTKGINRVSINKDFGENLGLGGVIE